MTSKETQLQKQIRTGGDLLIAEVSPPKGADAEAVRQLAGLFSGRVHALGISDSRDGVQMSAVAAASIASDAGMEPLLHMVTRDRNRIALVSECIGANALGIHNILCTSGTHQTLAGAANAKNVHDIDPVHLLGMLSAWSEGKLHSDAGSSNGVAPFCLAAVASPYADPAPLQLMRLSKKVAAGAGLLITQPVFDMERFKAWLGLFTERGLHEKAALVAGVRPLLKVDEARAYAERRPTPVVPESVLAALEAAPDAAAAREVGIETAAATIKQLAGLQGLRGFEIHAADDPEAALEVMERAGLEAN